MAQICLKHDVSYDKECWCCEETELNKDPAKRKAAYSDPQFLKKRGGLDAGTAAQSAILNKLSQLTPEQIDKLLAVAGVAPSAPSGGGTRTVIA